MTSNQKRALLVTGVGLGLGFILFELLKSPTHSVSPELPAPAPGSLGMQPGLPPPRQITTSSALVATESGPLSMRSNPSPQADVIERVPKGESVLLAPVVPQNGFVLAFYQGTLGWLYSGFLQNVPSSGPAPIPPVAIPPQGPVAPAPIQFLGNPLVLQQGRRYQARLELSGLSALASPDQVASKFAELGFSGVRVFPNKASLPATWPRETTNGDTANTRWAEGTFTRVNTSVARPDAVVQVWEAVGIV
jgi:hypothetical protein